MKSEPGRVRQVNHLIKRLAGERGPVIIAGDFNALPVFPSYGVVAKHYKDAASGEGELAYTRRTGGLGARIDYVFLSDSVVSSSYRVWPVEYSDHRPITVELVILSPMRVIPGHRSGQAQGPEARVDDQH
jgi:endonuclease/exonuclease/phosphatase (EEP) superfamily protein YafD